jgi:hypothetical protein
MDELEAYRFQLAELEESLQTDPDNSELLQLKEDIEEAIRLHESLLPEPIVKKSKQDIPSASVTETSLSSRSIAYSKAESVEKVGLKEDGWSIGDACYIDSGEQATVIGISANRLLVTIRLSINSAVKVLHKEKLYTAMQPAAKGRNSYDSHASLPAKPTIATAPEKRQSLQQGKSKSSKPKSTYMQYIQKKEAEQASKAHQWKSFSSTLQKKGARPI